MNAQCKETLLLSSKTEMWEQMRSDQLLMCESSKQCWQNARRDKKNQSSAVCSPLILSGGMMVQRF